MSEMKFSKWLRNRLTELDMRPRRLSQESGITESALSKLLKGARFPTVDTLQKIAPTLNCTVQDILVTAGYMKEEEKDSKNVHYADIPITGEFCDGKYKKDEYLGLTATQWADQAHAIVCRGDGMLPVARDGDNIVYNSMVIPKSGDMVYVKLKDREPLIKKFIRLPKDKSSKAQSIVFQSWNQVDSSPIVVGKDDIEFMYKIVSIIYK